MLDAVFRLRIPELSQNQIASAYELAEVNSDTDGPPNTVWGWCRA